MNTTFDESVIEKIVDSTRDLLLQHWDHVKGIRDTDPESTVKIGFSFVVHHSAENRIHVLSKIGYAQRFSDEREDWVEDPAQEKLPL